MINACAESNRTDEALAVLSSVKSYGLVPNVYCYSAAAKSCLARNRWRDSLALLAEAQSLGVPTDATLYRTVLRCCWQARQWKSVLQLYGEMVERGLEVDARMYHQLMESVARAGQTDIAADLLQDMVANSIDPLDSTLSAFLQCFYVKGDYEAAWQYIDGVKRWEDYDIDHDDDMDTEGEQEMNASQAAKAGKKGLNLSPQVFADLMGVCGRREDWAETLNLVERMKKTLGSVDVTAPHLLVRAFAELGEWIKAREFLEIEVRHRRNVAVSL